MFCISFFQQKNKGRQMSVFHGLKIVRLLNKSDNFITENDYLNNVTVIVWINLKLNCYRICRFTFNS